METQNNTRSQHTLTTHAHNSNSKEKVGLETLQFGDAKFLGALDSKVGRAKPVS